VVNIKDSKLIQPGELKGLDITPGDALLFKTANSTSGRNVSGVFSEDFVYISPEAARFCAEKGVGLVGIDYGSVDRRSETDFPAHYELLGNEILILEGINLKNVPPGRYTLFCLPLKIKGAEGAPARAVLVR
jgi:arylformamidase